MVKRHFAIHQIAVKIQQDAAIELIAQQHAKKTK